MNIRNHIPSSALITPGSNKKKEVTNEKISFLI